MGVAHALRSMGVPAIPNCHRRSAVYYWRRWTPGPRRVLLQVSLGVKEPRTARSLSLMLTAKSEELFPRYRAGQMNKTELLTYLHHCLDQSRPSQCADGIDLLSSGLAAHMAATRGPSARLDTGDRMGLNKAWGQSGLAERVEESLRARRRAEPNVEQFIIDSVTASLALGREPSGVDTEQAARVRWLAEALQAFQTLSDRSLVGLGTEQFVSDIKLGKGLPPEQSRQQRLSDWLSETIQYSKTSTPQLRTRTISNSAICLRIANPPYWPI